MAMVATTQTEHRSSTAAAGSRRIVLVITDERRGGELTTVFGHAPLDRHAPLFMADHEAALRILATARHDVALVDLRTNPERGVALIRRAAAAGSPTPMIALFGDDDPEIEVLAYAAGAADCLLVSLLNARHLARLISFARTEALAREELVRAQQGIAAIEEVGRALASDGPTPAALRLVTDVLVDRLGYELPSIYLGTREIVRLGAQRGYDEPIEMFTSDVGVVGRVMRTEALAFLPTTSGDPDYVSAQDNANAEISVPLVVDGDFLGVLNIESTSSRPLDTTDVRLVAAIADRLAVAIALGRERTAIADRAEMLGRLNAFSTRVGSTLDARDLHQRIVDEVQNVVPCAASALVLRDRASDAFLVVATRGGDPKSVGVTIDLDDGLSGQAIATGGVVDGPPVDTAALAQLYPDATDWSTVPSTAWAVSIALVVADEAVGALTLWRYAEAPFAELDREALNLVAVQVSLALANAQLHDAVAELAIRDGLTGLHNRRYFDEVFGLVIAGRARVDPGERRPLAAILFDLDEFGQLNKRHGHQVGDEVLRVFGRILRQRFRSSDIVARYGGEEFIVILEGATPDDVETLANDVRSALSAADVPSGEGLPLPITVSAGCAMLADADETGEALLAMADVGLTLAKRGGRNRVVRV